MDYDDNNVFAKILRGEIPCEKVYESDTALAFRDIAPAAPVHVLVIPKGKYTSFCDFMGRAGIQEVQQFFASVSKVAGQLNLDDFRIITNNGELSGQTVHHFHVHILSGRALGPLVADRYDAA